MQDCLTLKEDCPVLSCDQYHSSFCMEHIHALLKEHQTCRTTVVYVRSPSLEGDVKTELCYKELDDECNIFFTRKGDYYYFYDGLLQRMLLWSKHPKSFGQKGLVGSHFSIGPSKMQKSNQSRMFDIHATQYDYFNAATGNVKIIAPNMKRTYYHLDGKSRIQSNDRNHPLSEYLCYIWDYLRCAKLRSVSIPPQEGSGKPHVRQPVKPLIHTSRRRKETTPYNGTLRIIDRRRIETMLAKRVHGFIRLPYIPEQAMMRVAKEVRCLSQTKCKIELQLFSHHDAPCSFIWFLPHRSESGENGQPS